MKNTQAIFGEEFSEKIMEGVELVEMMVTATMGSHGKYILLEDEDGNIRPTKDGVSVAHSIIPEDPVVAMGAKMVIDGSVATVRKIGDGTTTTALLTASLYKQLMSLKKEGRTSRDLMISLEVEKQAVLKEITSLKKTFFDKDVLKKIALVSANHDEEIAEVVSEVWDKIGAKGVVELVVSDTGSTSFEVKSGFRINKGYLWEKFANKGLKAVYDECMVFATDHTIDGLAPIGKLIEIARSKSLPLLIFAPEFENRAIESMLKNHKEGVVQFLPIEWPQFGDKDSLGEELASVSGGAFISKAEYSDLTKVDWSKIGTVKKVVADGVTTVISFDEENPVYLDYVNTAKKLDARLARIKGKIATIRIHGNTDAEYNFKYDMYDDCVKAVGNAIETGYVAGGGSTYRYLATKTGIDILKLVLLSPMTKLLQNYGCSTEEVERIVDDSLNDPYGTGIDLNRFENGKVDLNAEGLIEPAGLVSTCIDNACSIASLLFNTEAGITVVRSLIL